MIFAKVTGSVVSSQKDAHLKGKKLLLCKEVDCLGKPMPSYHVAVDAVQAGEGDLVLLSYGSSARMTDVTRDAPIDAVIMAIVDGIQLIGQGKRSRSPVKTGRRRTGGKK